MLREFFHDPVILFSFGGLAIVIGICLFYLVYFIRNIVNADEPKS